MHHHNLCSGFNKLFVQGHVPNSDKSDCDPCPVGMYRGVDDMTCQVCPVGQNTEGETGQEQCVKCPKVYFFKQ